MERTLFDVANGEEVAESLEKSVHASKAADKHLKRAFSMCVSLESKLMTEIVSGSLKVGSDQWNLGAEVPRLAHEYIFS